MLLLVVVGMIAAACSSADSPAICNAAHDLATVNGADITCEDLYLLRPEYGDIEVSADAEMVRNDLMQLVQAEAFVTAAAEQYGAEITEAMVDERISDPPARWAALFGGDRPAGEVRSDAITSLVRDAVVPQLIIEEFGDIETYVEQRPQDVVQVCVRVIVVEDEAAGAAVMDRIAAGEDFLALRDEVSLDQQSDGLVTADGTCPVNVTPLGDEFALAVATVPIDEVAGPVAIGGFFGVYRVEERLAPDPSTDLAAELLDFVDPGSQSARFGTWAGAALRAADVEVASAIGRWSPDALAIAPPGLTPPSG
jgi:parvulin-like peptidyl-prolyl isomerase